MAQHIHTYTIKDQITKAQNTGRLFTLAAWEVHEEYRNQVLFLYFFLRTLVTRTRPKSSASSNTLVSLAQTGPT